MKAEIARHIVESGGLLAKDSVLHLLDCIESADRKIEQLIADRQQAISELASAQRERDGYLHSSTVYSDRAFKAEAELKRRYAQEPVDAVNAGEEIYKIANHIASAKGGMPDEWQSWADEIESDLCRCVVPAAVFPVISGKRFTGALNVLNDCLDDCRDSEQGLMLAFRAAGLEVKF